MKATIVGLQAGYSDGEVRVTLRFSRGEPMYNELRFPVSALGGSGLGTGPHLGQEIEVELNVPKTMKTKT